MSVDETANGMMILLNQAVAMVCESGGLSERPKAEKTRARLP